MTNAVIAIIGPTCSGKTDLSIKLAQKVNGEIVTLDSRTIYQKMDIGTAKPTFDQQAAVRHHLLDILEPIRFFSVAEYVELARVAIDSILACGKLPIVCGGTGLYAQALLEGIQIPAVPPQPALREKLNIFAEREGNQQLHNWLNRVDPLAASRLNVNDRRRVIRALEVSITAGQPYSLLARKVDPPYKTIWIGLKWKDRAFHKQLIVERLEEQLRKGLLKEVEGLWQQQNYRSVLENAINYKEFIPHFENATSFDQAHQECISNNFQLARKQMIWFRVRPQINWLVLDDMVPEERLSSMLAMVSDL